MANPSSYDIGVVGAGLGGLSAAIALRRAGHRVTLYERFAFDGEVGASLSLASNGSRFLAAWGVPVSAARPVVLRSLVRHDWASGAVISTYPLGDYRARFGADYHNFHRIDLHRTLAATALGEDGEGGPPAVLRTWRRATALHPETGTVVFATGETATHDAVICADGIRSALRPALLGAQPDVTPSASCCYRCIISREALAKLGLQDFADASAIEFWGGEGIDKIVLSPCSSGSVVSCYCFYAAAKNDETPDGWDQATTGARLAATFPGLDPRLRLLFAHADDVNMWRLYHHAPYARWTRGVAALLGDAAHPMMPDQSQGACMAVEDAAALGILFGPRYAALGGVREKLLLYERVRLARATRLQEASKRARTDIRERIGWSSASDLPGKLTIEEVCGYDMHAHIEEVVAEYHKERTGRDEVKAVQ